MDTFAEYLNVYRNLIKFVDYRGAKLKSDVLKDKNVINTLNHNEYIMIESIRPSDDIRAEYIHPKSSCKITIFMIAKGSKYGNQSNEAKKLFKIAHKNNKLRYHEIIFISDIAFKASLTKLLLSNSDKHISAENYSYDIFMLEVPKHSLVPEHKIITIKQLDDFCKKYYISPSNMPKISRKDPMAVWLGLKPGICVEIIRPSDNAGYAHVYRICI